MIYENTWYVGDCVEMMKQIPDQSIPCILTDPPYNISNHDMVRVHSQFVRICKGVILVFCPPENQWVLPAEQYLFWIKPISTKNTSLSYSRFVEMIQIYGRLRWNCHRHWSQYTNVFTDLVDDTKDHEFRKPPSLIERLIRNHTDPGDIILDPFAGSGVVVDKARELGRKWIAMDKDASRKEKWECQFMEQSQ